MRTFRRLAGAILLANIAWAIWLWTPPTNPPVQILVIDDFGDDHGQSVSRIARKWSLGRCEIRSFATNLSGPDYHAALQAALHHVRSHPDRRFVVNLSLGSPSPDPAERQLIQALADADVLIVASAGNLASDEPSWPAAYEPVLAVAAARHGRRANYSSFGRFVDLTVETTESAPGPDDFSLDPQTGRFVRRYSIREGTSFAAPKLAGLAGAAWHVRTDASADQLRADLLTATEPMNDPAFADGLLGTGRFDEHAWLLQRVPAARWGAIGLAGAVAALAACWLGSMRQTLPGLIAGAFWLGALTGLAVLADAVIVLTYGATVAAISGLAMLAGARALSKPLGGKRVALAAVEWTEDSADRLEPFLADLGADVVRLEPAGTDQRFDLLIALPHPGTFHLHQRRWAGLLPPGRPREFTSSATLIRYLRRTH